MAVVVIVVLVVAFVWWRRRVPTRQRKVAQLQGQELGRMVVQSAPRFTASRRDSHVRVRRPVGRRAGRGL